eukprot:TRINITY_DN6010_c0_g1_i1.p1 TRINITY_DN6010_c0_g1~~TRINITY_DN6010_c0_g1_i1.p1  ORF type:complete len:352 (-),score=70.80 TRINITY_DN6010_c0_g1_i1:175-1230(-)
MTSVTGNNDDVNYHAAEDGSTVAFSSSTKEGTGERRKKGLSFRKSFHMGKADVVTIEEAEVKAAAKKVISSLLHERRDFKWIVLGASLLALIAGWVNLVNIKIVGHPVTHVSGSVSNIANNLVASEWVKFAEYCCVVLFFCLGSMIAAVIVGNEGFQMGRKYGLAIMAAGFLVLIGSLIFEFIDITQADNAGIRIFTQILLSCAAGIQNGLCTSFSGAVVRTTHVTGIVTDIGLTIGYWIRYHNTKPEKAHLWKLKLHVPIVVSFLIGGIFGALSFTALDTFSNLIPACFFILVGAAYFGYGKFGAFKDSVEQQQIAKKVERRLTRAIWKAAQDPHIQDRGTFDETTMSIS